MSRNRTDHLEALTHFARVQFIKHELNQGLDLVRLALDERTNDNQSRYEIAKARAVKTHQDFSEYLKTLSGRLTALEEEELDAHLNSLAEALRDLD